MNYVEIIEEIPVRAIWGILWWEFQNSYGDYDMESDGELRLISHMEKLITK